jgi:tetratricopeptide (TPR) repeat protein
VIVLFMAALFSKTVTCSLPAVLLLVHWWKQPRLSRKAVMPLAPMFAIGLGLGLVTAWIEQHHAGATGEDWSMSVAERVLIAGRALWFYVGKLAWPDPLIFMYPKWGLDAGSAFQWVFPAAALGAGGAAWALRGRIGKGAFVAWAAYCGTLLPALGFFNVYPMRYAYVADHFQYVASIAAIAAVIAGLTRLAAAASRQRLAMSFGTAVLVLFTGLTIRQTQVYADRITLWTDVIRKHPGSWMAHNNLGISRYQQQDYAQAKDAFLETIRIKPDHAEAHNNLGMLHSLQGDEAQALSYYGKALELKPTYAEAHNGLAATLVNLGRIDEARAHYEEAIRLRPDYAPARYNFGLLELRQGRTNEAARRFTQALRIDPEYARARQALEQLRAQGLSTEAGRRLQGAR